MMMMMITTTTTTIMMIMTTTIMMIVHRTTCRRNGGILPQVFDADTGHAIWDLATIKGHNLWLSLRSSQRVSSVEL